MGFVKIHDALLDSSIMEEAIHVRWVWVAMLSITNQDGLVRGTRAALARHTNVTAAQLDEALAVLMSPDPDSTNKAEQGRRLVQPSPNIWRVVNYEIYRQLASKEDKAEKNRARQKRYYHRQRARQAEEEAGNLTPPNAFNNMGEGEGEGEGEGDTHTGVAWCLAEWNATAAECGLPKITIMSDHRLRAARRRVAEHGEPEVRRALNAPKESKFLRGIKTGGVRTNGGPWKASFDWLMKADNMTKVLEDTYRDAGLPPRRTAAEVAEQEGREQLMRNITEYRAALLETDLPPAAAELARDHSRALSGLVKAGGPRGTMCMRFFEEHDAFVGEVYKMLASEDVGVIDTEVETAEKQGVKPSTYRRKLVQQLLGLPDPLSFDLEEEGA